MAESDSTSRAEGLLEQIADTALDDDYYVVRSGPYRQAHEFNTVLTGVVLGVFALLVSIAAIQTSADRPATERERETLISDVAARKELVASREATADKLRREVAKLSSTVSGFDPALQELRIVTGDLPVTGQGISVIVTPNDEIGELGQIREEDLRVIVNGLWYAGAEAVSVNGNRLGSMSAIRSAEGVIKVNYLGIAPPYVIDAIGDKDTLASRFEDNPAGQFWEQRHDSAGVGYSVTGSSKLTMGAVPEDRLTTRYAKAIKEPE